MNRLASLFITYALAISLLISTIEGRLCLCTCCNPSIGRQPGCITDIGVNGAMNDCRISCWKQCPRQCPLDRYTGTIVDDSINGINEPSSVCSGLNWKMNASWKCLQNRTLYRFFNKTSKGNSHTYDLTQFSSHTFITPIGKAPSVIPANGSIRDWFELFDDQPVVANLRRA
jgi:hypothetical protein